MRLDTGPGHGGHRVDTRGHDGARHGARRHARNRHAAAAHRALVVPGQDLTRDLLRAEDLVRVVINWNLLAIGLRLGRTELRLRRMT